MLIPSNVSAAQYGQEVLGKKDEPAIVDRKPGLALNMAVISGGLFGTSAFLFYLSKRRKNNSSFHNS